MNIEQAREVEKRLRKAGNYDLSKEAADVIDALIAETGLLRDLIAMANGNTERAVAERDALKTLVANVHKAKGRYHNQLAMCALYDAVGLPNVRPISGQKEFGENHEH